MRRALPALLCALAGCQCGPSGPVFDASSGTLWISSQASGRVMVLDAADGGWIGQVDLPGDGGRGAAVSVSPDGERVFVADEGAGAVHVLEVRELRVQSTAGNLLRPRDVQPSPNGQVLYVAQAGSDELAIIELGLFVQVRRVPAGGGAAASATQSVWATPQGAVYVANQLSSTVVRLDVPSGPARWSLPVALTPTRLVANRAGDVGYVTGAEDGVVQQVFLSGTDAPDGGPAVPVGGSPTWLSLSQDDRWLVVSNGQVDNTISVLDLPRGFIEQGKVVVGGGNVGHNALSPGGSIAYVAVGLPPRIAVVDLEQRTVVGAYPLPEAPRGVAFVPPLQRR